MDIPIVCALLMTLVLALAVISWLLDTSSSWLYRCVLRTQRAAMSMFVLCIVLLWTWL